MQLYVDKYLQEPISNGNIYFLNDQDNLFLLDKSKIVKKE